MNDASLILLGACIGAGFILVLLFIMRELKRCSYYRRRGRLVLFDEIADHSPDQCVIVWFYDKWILNAFLCSTTDPAEYNSPFYWEDRGILIYKFHLAKREISNRFPEFKIIESSNKWFD